MSTKRIMPLTAPTRIRLAAKDIEIEVPAGVTEYYFKQSAGERQYTFHLRYPDSQLLIRGLVVSKGDSKPQLSTSVIHHLPYTQADTLIKTLADGHSQPRYNGLIRIAAGAHDCESYLNHHSLVISPKARSWTRPSLEILNDQVKCSHAATVRTITEEDLFYLRARGISAEEAREMLIQAFLS